MGVRLLAFPSFSLLPYYVQLLGRMPNGPAFSSGSVSPLDSEDEGPGNEWLQSALTDGAGDRRSLMFSREPPQANPHVSRHDSSTFIETHDRHDRGYDERFAQFVPTVDPSQAESLRSSGRSYASRPQSLADQTRRLSTQSFTRSVSDSLFAPFSLPGLSSSSESPPPVMGSSALVHPDNRYSVALGLNRYCGDEEGSGSAAPIAESEEPREEEHDPGASDNGRTVRGARAGSYSSEMIAGALPGFHPMGPRPTLPSRPTTSGGTHGRTLEEMGVPPLPQRAAIPPGDQHDLTPDQGAYVDPRQGRLELKPPSYFRGDTPLDPYGRSHFASSTPNVHTSSPPAQAGPSQGHNLSALRNEAVHYTPHHPQGQ
ncbi:hypothetical protein T439DRAFT_359361 [Meredithblackwellia eburnea MCA 4105]